MRTSPFVKSAESDKSVHFLVKKSRQVTEAVNETVTELFPISHDVPHSIRFYMAVIYVALIITAFIYLFYTGYQTTLDNEFLSPYSGFGSPSSNCETIPVSYSGSYLAGQAGHWEGNESFTYAQAAYQLTIISYAATVEEQHVLMGKHFADYAHYGAIAKTHDLAYSMLLWMSLVFANATSVSHRFLLIGTPLTVFDRDYTEGAISSVHGNCNLTASASFDAYNGVMSLSYNYKDFIANPICMQAMNPALFGYNTLSKPDMFTVSYDVRTLVTGIAVNIGILKMEQLIEVTEFRRTLDAGGGVNVEVGSFYDPKYPGMKNIMCVMNRADPTCMMQIGSVVAFPLYNHLGANLTSPVLCDCSVLTTDILADKTHDCNVFRFLSGLLYVNSIEDVAYMFTIKAKVGSIAALNKQAHRAMFIASSFGQNSPEAEELNSPSSLQAAYNFCQVGSQMCSILTFSSYDLVATNWAVTQYGKQVRNGACADSVSLTPEKWNELRDHPYAPLSQKYQMCKYDLLQTMINQAGIAIGNIQIIAPILIIFLMLVTMLHKSYNQVPLDESYSKAAKDSALDAYAMSLLLARDQCLKTVGFRNNNSIIALIAEELGEHTVLSTVSHKKRKEEQSSSHLSISNFNLTSPRMEHAMKKINPFTKITHVGNHAGISIAPEEQSTPISPNVASTGSSKYYVTYDEEQHQAKQDRHQAEQFELQNMSLAHAGDLHHRQSFHQLDARKSAIIDAAIMKATMEVIDIEN